MKTMTAILGAAVVMAATGCETAQQKEARGLMQIPDGRWVPKGTRYFGDGKYYPKKEEPRSAVAYNGPPPPPEIFQTAPIVVPPIQVGSPAPQPVIVVGPNSGTTIASQTGVGTVVTSFGGYRPIGGGYVAPPIDTRGRPIYYTEAINQ